MRLADAGRLAPLQPDTLKQHWEALGHRDEFLATGEREVAELFGELEALGATPNLGRALDFGCGVGRLTQALAVRFERCDGVDITASMIEQARQINRHGERVSYHVAAGGDLAVFDDGSFDFVLSFIALQHMEPRYAKRYIAEFIRVLAPGGLALFQLPSAADGAPTADQPAPSQARSRPGPGAQPVIEMHGIGPVDVEQVVVAAGGAVLHRAPDVMAGPGVESHHYVVRRTADRTPPLPRTSLRYLEAAIAAVPNRPDMFPPVITRRQGTIGTLELRLRQKLGRALRSLTWAQAEYDRAALRALQEARAALREQQDELDALRRELEELRGSRDGQSSSG
jgi:SAM-dependent methyltransferase